MSNQQADLEYVLNGLMNRYRDRVPAVGGILEAMVKEGMIGSEEEIENDHIAFRTMGVPGLGIASLEKIFLYYGYHKREYYEFPEKKLNAYWYSPPALYLPRIFISELRVPDLSKHAQDIIHEYTSQVKGDPADSLNMEDPESVVSFLHGSLWSTPYLNDYLELAKESEYAAWVIYNKYYLNHFTISVHNLPEDFNTLEKFNAFVESNGFRLNDSGGKIKTSEDGLLAQSSTVAEMVEAHFADGVSRMIAGSYVEFAERRVLPEYREMDSSLIERHHRREGFEASNADKIFESTYDAQTLNQIR